MKGLELRQRRIRLRYSQEEFIGELGVKSRQTLISWEQSADELPRLVQLAVLALERLPDCRRRFGKRAKAHERKAFKSKVAKTDD